MTQIIEIMDEIGNIDLCECEPVPGTRIIRVIKRVKKVEVTEYEDNTYSIHYSHACGYKD